MRAVVQRTKGAQVTVDEQVIGKIGLGLVVLLGVTQEDTVDDVNYLVEKIAHLRIFEDEAGKMNRSLLDVGGSLLVISQFTLYGDCRKGRRPSFIKAARPEQANDLYEQFVAHCQALGILTETGQFQAEMDVSLVNWGPVTMLLDSQKGF